MPARTIGLRPLNFREMFSTLARMRQRPAIIGGRFRREVRRIDTASMRALDAEITVWVASVTGMIDVHALRDRAYERLVREAVG